MERSLVQSHCVPSNRLVVRTRPDPLSTSAWLNYTSHPSYSPPSGTSSTPSVASTLSRPPHRDFTYANLRPARGSTTTAQLFGVPYSEHSSFYELTCFALSIDWARIVATVNVERASSRAKISAWVARWEAERRAQGGGAVVVQPYRSPEYW